MQFVKMRFQNVAKRLYYQIYLSVDLLGDWVLTTRRASVGIIRRLRRGVKQIDYLVNFGYGGYMSMHYNVKTVRY
jgi:hypothetical protein